MKKKKTITAHGFRLYDDERNRAGFGAGQGRVLLFPFHNLSVQQFSFPFSGMSRVRDALKIQFRPLLGDRVDAVSFVPFLTKAERKHSEGSIFLLHGDNTARLETGDDDSVIVWPLPLTFAAEVEGTGIVVWADDEQVVSLWLQNWVPMLYRWTDRRDGDAEQETALMLAYASEQNNAPLPVFVAGRNTDVQACGERTLKAYPAYEHLDLSNRGAKFQEQREKTVGSLIKGLRTAMLLGLVFAAVSGGLYLQRRSAFESLPSLQRNLYASAFGEQSASPLSSVSTKLSSLQGGGHDSSLQTVLKMLGGIWEELSESGGVVIETMRYSQEKTDLLGTAKDNNAIQRLRTLLEERSFTHRTENIQQIPGGGLRFTISITGGNKQ